MSSAKSSGVNTSTTGTLKINWAEKFSDEVRWTSPWLQGLDAKEIHVPYETRLELDHEQ